MFSRMCLMQKRNTVMVSVLNNRCFTVDLLFTGSDYDLTRFVYYYYIIISLFNI